MNNSRNCITVHAFQADISVDFILQFTDKEAGSLVGCLVFAWYSDGCGCDPPVVVIGHEIISTTILSLWLIQVGQLSVTGERMCTKNWLTS